MTPEQKARADIDRQLAACGWIVQNHKAMNIMAGVGLAVREFPLKKTRQTKCKPRVDQYERASPLPVPIAPIREQAEIVREVEDRLSMIEKAEAELQSGRQRASRLRQSILKRAFEGKLVPQDPNDEPASVLLERIRAARASDASSGERSRSRKGYGDQRQRSVASTRPPKRGKKKAPKRDLFAELVEGFDSLKRERDV